jgi:GWxTD domain-containing protein
LRAVEALVAGLVSLFLLVPGLQAAREPSIGELTNFALSPELSQWLVGPVSRIATESEIRQYLAVDDDDAARKFIEDFWRRRQSDEIAWPDEQPRAVFDRRAEEADRLFTEGVNLGRRTDRGGIHVLYGPPAEKKFESDPNIRMGPLEVWEYGKKSEKGLDGKRPKRLYRFVKSGDVTVLLGSADRPGRIVEREMPD